jgi:Domain of unknown function (DUF4136)
MKILVLSGALVLMAAAPAAFGQKITTQSWTKAPPGTYTTYQYRTGRSLTSTGFKENPTLDAMIKAGVEKEMQKLGFTEAPNGQLVVSYRAGVTMKVRIDEQNLGDDMQWDFGSPFGEGGRAYQKNSLNLTVVDSRTQTALWAATVTDNFVPKSLEATVDRAIEKSFQKFPLKP